VKTTSYRESLVEIVNREEVKKKIMEDPDFIKSHKYGNSLSKFLSNNNGDLENATIARLLMISEDEVENIYKEVVDFIKNKMQDGKDESN